MSRPYEHPVLTPHFCFNQTALRDFLRLSRSAIDDSITQNLNALMTPASEGFNPTSTDARQLQNRPPSRRSIDQGTCQEFKTKVLFPSWQVRSDVINYCAAVATTPEPEDNDPRHELQKIESALERERMIDERLDPYSARYFPQQTRQETLISVLRNERGVEKIIRSRTWALLGERCGLTELTSDQALDAWRNMQDPKT